MILPRNRALLAGAGVAAIASGLWLGRPLFEPPRATLLPDVGGPIVLAAATASSARRSPLRSAALVTELGQTLPERIELLLLTNDREAFTLRASERNVRFVELSPDAPLTIWPQDPFLVLRRAGGAHSLLASRDFDRAADEQMAEALADALGWELRRSPLHFEGGNVVSDASRVFIGADTIARNVADLGLRPEEVAARFEALLGLPVTVLGPSPQPIAHIDLAITPLGEGRLLVADPGQGAALAESALAREPALAEQFEARTRERFFGHPDIASLALADGSRLEPPDLHHATRRAIEASRALAAPLDALAAGLAARGYTVERVPLLAGPPRTGDGPGYPTLSYNNVLLETASGGPRVYLPRYGFAPLDDAASTTWRGQGFEVVRIDGLATSAMYGGALRCALKVLARADAG